jgi:hypothetical protein
MKEIEIFRKLLIRKNLDRIVDVRFDLDFSNTYKYNVKLTIRYPLNYSNEIENLLNITSLRAFLTKRDVTLMNFETFNYEIEDIFIL